MLSFDLKGDYFVPIQACLLIIADGKIIKGMRVAVIKGIAGPKINVGDRVLKGSLRDEFPRRRIQLKKHHPQRAFLIVVLIDHTDEAFVGKY